MAGLRVAASGSRSWLPWGELLLREPPGVPTRGGPNEHHLGRRRRVGCQQSLMCVSWGPHYEQLGQVGPGPAPTTFPSSKLHPISYCLVVKDLFSELPIHCLLISDVFQHV